VGARVRFCGYETAGTCQARFVSGGASLIGYVFYRQARALSVPRFDRTISIWFADQLAQQTMVKLTERLDETPAGAHHSGGASRPRRIFQVRLWAGRAAAPFPVDPPADQPRHKKLSSAFFQVDIELPLDVAPAAAFGSRAYVRFSIIIGSQLDKQRSGGGRGQLVLSPGFQA